MRDIHSSGERRNAPWSRSIFLAKVVFPEPGKPHIRNRVAMAAMVPEGILTRKSRGACRHRIVAVAVLLVSIPEAERATDDRRTLADTAHRIGVVADTATREAIAHH